MNWTILLSAWVATTKVTSTCPYCVEWINYTMCLSEVCLSILLFTSITLYIKNNIKIECCLNAYFKVDLNFYFASETSYEQFAFKLRRRLTFSRLLNFYLWNTGLITVGDPPPTPPPTPKKCGQFCLTFIHLSAYLPCLSVKSWHQKTLHPLLPF